MFSNKGQSSSQLINLIVPMIVVAILAVSFSIIASNVGNNYDVSYDDSSYEAIINQSSSINSIANRTGSSMLSPEEDRSNVLTAFDKLTTGAYNTFLVLSDVPGIYFAVITVISDAIGIDGRIVTLILSGIVISIVAVAVYLALGRR